MHKSSILTYLIRYSYSEGSSNTSSEEPLEELEDEVGDIMPESRKHGLIQKNGDKSENDLEREMSFENQEPELNEEPHPKPPIQLK